MRIAVAAALSLPLLAVGPAAIAHTARGPLQPRLLFSSSLVSSSLVAGDAKAYSELEIYSLLPSAHRPAQLTFTGGDDPVPSPNGRLIAFSRGDDLWLMSADGRRQRPIAVGMDPAWAPDSSRVAYVSTDVQGKGLGISEVGIDGRAGKTLARGAVTAPAWSPDNHSLAFLRATSAQPATSEIWILRGGKQHAVAGTNGAESPSWSPDGRWLAFTSCVSGNCGVFLVHADGSGRRFVSAGSSPAWSPRGRRLAYIDDRSIRTLDLATGARRVLVEYQQFPFPSDIAWSPDATRIAYALFNSEDDLTRVETVSLGRRIRSLGTYPDAAGLAWTTPPTHLHYRAPQDAGPIAVGNELRFRLPVDELAADGDAVAYRTCGSIGRWSPSNERVETARSEAPLCNFQDNYLQYYSLALAGDEVGWGEVEGGNSQDSALRVARAGANAPELLAAGPGITNGPRTTARVGDLVGSGSLLAFSTWTYCDDVFPSSCLDTPLLQRPISSQTLWRIREPPWPGGCPGIAPAQLLPRCERLRTEPGPLQPLDVDAGRIVASGDNATLVLDADGAQLLSLPVPVRAAQLTGSDLVLLAPGALRDYDAMTGALLHTWPLPAVSFAGFCGLPSRFCGSPRLRLEGAARGLVAYLLDGKLHLLRLRDGADTTVADASAAQLDESGLFYAYRTTGIWPGRIRFVPFDQLPIR